MGESETLSTSDSPTHTSGVFRRIITELSTTAEVVSRTANFFRKVFDVVTGSDHVRIGSKGAYRGEKVVELTIPEPKAIALPHEDAVNLKVEEPKTYVRNITEDEIEVSAFRESDIEVNKPALEFTVEVEPHNEQEFTRYDDLVSVNSKEG